jgi:hypothetical protein
MRNLTVRVRGLLPIIGILLLTGGLACNMPAAITATAPTSTPADQLGPALVVTAVPSMPLIIPASPTPRPGPSPTATPDPFAGQPYQDARDIFSGVCFNYWESQIGRIFVLTTAFEHIDFYNGVDGAQVCRFPVERNPFDFEQGRILIGAVNVGTGCAALTDPIALMQDDTARTITMRLTWGVTGECPYRLARPFWVSIPRPPEGYTVAFEFVPPGE